jgi:ribosomal protein L24
VEAAGEAHIR